MSIYHEAPCGHSVEILGSCKICKFESIEKEIEQLENRLKELEATIQFVYEHLESMNGYSVVSGARAILKEALEEQLNEK